MIDPLQHKWIAAAREREPLSCDSERREWFDKKRQWLYKILVAFEQTGAREQRAYGEYYEQCITEHERFVELCYAVEGGWGPVSAVSVVCKNCFYMRSSCGHNSPGSKSSDAKNTKSPDLLTSEMRELCPRGTDNCTL